MDMNQGSGCKNKPSFAAANDTKPYTFQSSETAKSDGDKFSIIDNPLTSNVELLDGVTTFSEKASTERLTDDSVKYKTSTSCHLENQDAFGTEFGHLPMSNVNQELESSMASMKKSAYGDMFIRMVKGKWPLAKSVGNLHQVKLASACWLSAKTVIDNAEKVMIDNEGLLLDNADRNPYSVNYACKCQKTNGHTFHSGCLLACKSHVNTELPCMHHKSCCSCNPKFTAIDTESKTGSMDSNLSGSWITLKNQSTCVLKESSSIDFAYSLSTERRATEENDNSYNRSLHSRKRLPDKTNGSDMCYWPHKSLKCSTKDVGQHEYFKNFKCLNGGDDLHKFSSSISYSLLDNMGTNDCHRDPQKGDSTLPQVKEYTFSKTITIPADHGKKDVSTIPFENFTHAIDKVGCNVGTHVMGAHSQSSTKTVCVSSYHRSGSSLLGETFSWTQKDATYPNLKKSEKSSASLTQPAINKDLGTTITDSNVEHPALTEISTLGSKQAISFRTESMDEDDQACLHVNKADFFSSNPPLDDQVVSETCSTWIQRLQRNRSETSLSSKSFKGAFGSTTEVQQEFSLLCCKEGAMQPWIRRWCHNLHRIEQENSRLQDKNLEGKLFASVQAMALVGRAISRYTPCRFKRKEALLVWNT